MRRRLYEKDQSRTESRGPDVTGGFVCGRHREPSHAVLQESSDEVLQEPSNALLSFQPPQITNKSIALDSQLLPKAATLVSPLLRGSVG